MTHAEKLNKFAMNLQKIMEERGINPNWRLFSDPDYPRYEQAYQDALKMTNEELEAMEEAQAPTPPSQEALEPDSRFTTIEIAITHYPNYGEYVAALYMWSNNKEGSIALHPLGIVAKTYDEALEKAQSRIAEFADKICTEEALS